jgi:hypothetical protein
LKQIVGNGKRVEDVIESGRLLAKGQPMTGPVSSKSNLDGPGATLKLNLPSGEAVVP